MSSLFKRGTSTSREKLNSIKILDNTYIISLYDNDHSEEVKKLHKIKGQHIWNTEAKERHNFMIITKKLKWSMSNDKNCCYRTGQSLNKEVEKKMTMSNVKGSINLIHTTHHAFTKNLLPQLHLDCLLLITDFQKQLKISLWIYVNLVSFVLNLS